MPSLRRRQAAITAPSGRVPGARAGRRALPLVAVAVLGALTLGPGAAAQEGSLSDSRLLWATVNICDTPSHPDTVGIRGAMPGTGRAAEQMFMRFQLQYLDRSNETWKSVGASSDSGFVPVGAATFRQRQSGRNFTVRPPAAGASTLRGAVTFEWRKGRSVVRRLKETTTGRHGPTAGADPAGFSASRCDVRD